MISSDISSLSVPLSALQHTLYCERQCALIHVERVWAENRQTADGRVLHERADSGRGEHRPGVRIARALAVQEERLGIHGVCDVVEFHADGHILPIEYKRGRPKAHRADEVQLCAQALCLEAMFGRAITSGALFYGKEQRRREIPFDEALRRLTEATIARTRALLASETLPSAEFSEKKCGACSLRELCQPEAFRLSRSVRTWFWREVHAESKTSES